MLSESEEEVFAVLGQESRSRLHKTHLTTRFPFDRDRGADRVAIALRPSQPKRDRWGQTLDRVLEQLQLGSISIFERNFETAVKIEIGQCECASILNKVQANNRRHI